jgi:hypothetical protein
MDSNVVRIVVPGLTPIEGNLSRAWVVTSHTGGATWAWREVEASETAASVASELRALRNVPTLGWPGGDALSAIEREIARTWPASLIARPSPAACSGTLAEFRALDLGGEAVRS